MIYGGAKKAIKIKANAKGKGKITDTKNHHDNSSINPKRNKSLKCLAGSSTRHSNLTKSISDDTQKVINEVIVKKASGC